MYRAIDDKEDPDLVELGCNNLWMQLATPPVSVLAKGQSAEKKTILHLIFLMYSVLQ
jgi:hypothetical protein